MKPFAKVFANLFDRDHVEADTAYRRRIQREWDRQRARAMTPREREEIDAIFSRAL